MVINMCPYSIDKSTLLCKNLFCNILNETCGFWRYCSEKNKPVMSNMYNKYGCKIKEEFENKRKGGDNIEQRRDS